MKKFSVLGLLRQHQDIKPEVVIVAHDFVPNKGAELQVLGLFKTEKDATAARDRFGEKQLLEYWGRTIFLEMKEDGRMVLAGPRRKAELLSLFNGE